MLEASFSCCVHYTQEIKNVEFLKMDNLAVLNMKVFIFW